MHPNQFLSDALRWGFGALGAVTAVLAPSLPYILICTLTILADCYTAWSLSKRVRKAHPDRVGRDGGKFNSHHFGTVVLTMMKAWTSIIMAFLMQRYITDGMPVDLTKVVAGVICFWQILSILENESSCNGARWAVILQRILVDKTSRHFDIDLNELKKR